MKLTWKREDALTMQAQAKRILIMILGWLFIILGIAGLFLPFLQGILFLLIGLYLLSHESRWAKTQLHKIKKRHPVLYGRFINFKTNFRGKFRQLLGKRV
ncbi:PGPGW domain-containing protein [Phosphitispora sp. TUW77]|uniref:PGPGW domain-containing protein n=1 Tax=Phosphitispora sp. TUW77 TaxID=3152361 RepID=UPI003AB85597